MAHLQHAEQLLRSARAELAALTRSATAEQFGSEQVAASVRALGASLAGPPEDKPAEDSWGGRP